MDTSKTQSKFPLVCPSKKRYLCPAPASACCPQLVSPPPVLPASPSSTCPIPGIQACCEQHCCQVRQCPPSHGPAALQTLCLLHEDWTEQGHAEEPPGRFEGLVRPQIGAMSWAELPCGAHDAGQLRGQPAVPAAALLWCGQLQGNRSQLIYCSHCHSHSLIRNISLQWAQLVVAADVALPDLPDVGIMIAG